MHARPLPAAALALLGTLAVLVVQLTLAAACPPKKDAGAADGSTGIGMAGAPSRPLSRFQAQPAGKRVAVVYTASVQGYVEPCGCTGDPLGGIARLAAVLDEARKAFGDRVLFLDGGDLLFEHLDDTAPVDRCQAEARADLLISTYARLGLAGTVLGPLDDVRGASFRDRRLAAAGLPTLGVTDARPLTDGAVRQASIVKTLGAAKIGVTAFRADDVGQVDGAHEKLLAEVQKLLGPGADGVDAVVVLAQAPRELTKKVVANVPGIDVIIQGRSPGEVPVAPETLEGGAVLVASGLQAQHAGVIELVLDGRAPGQRLALDDRKAQGERRAKVLEVRLKELKTQVAEAPEGPRKQFLGERLAAAEAELQSILHVDTTVPLPGPHLVARAIALPRGAPEEPVARTALEKYTASIPGLVASCEASATCPEPPAGARTFVGAETCKTCHAAAYDFWKAQVVTLPGKDAEGKPITRTVGHAHAWETLIVDGRDKDRSCVGCHSVGFGEPGGPCRTTDVVPKKLDGVQCESCHGAGSAHAASAKASDILRSPDEARCRTCHHVPHIPTTESFVFDERLKHILGPGHGEKRRAALGP